LLGAEAALEAVIKVVWGCSMLLNRGGGIWERDGSPVTPAQRVKERPKCLNSHSRHYISLEKVTLVSRDHHVLRHSMMILMMMMMMMMMMIMMI
jgi:hypothetical protein